MSRRDKRGRDHRALHGVENEPNRAPTKAHRSGFCGERRSRKVSELSPFRRKRGIQCWRRRCRGGYHPPAGRHMGRPLRVLRTLRTVGADVLIRPTFGGVPGRRALRDPQKRPQNTKKPGAVRRAFPQKEGQNEKAVFALAKLIISPFY